MKYIELNTTAKMPVIGLGTWRFDSGKAYQAIRWALKLGYTHFDCAPIYGNQTEIGQAFHDAFIEENIKREDLFITSKLWNDNHAPENVFPALEQTLKDLQLEYLDLWLMHWPIAQKQGIDMPHDKNDMIPLTELPLETTWAEMEKAFNSNKVKAIGVSNFGIQNLQKLIDKGEIAPAVNQVECHPYLQQNELIDFCHKNLIAVTAYSPLGSDTSNTNEPVLLEDAKLIEIANRLQSTPAQIALAWQLNRGLSVIPKSAHENHLRENIAALNILLDKSDMDAISQLNRNYRFITGKSFAFGDYNVETIFA